MDFFKNLMMGIGLVQLMSWGLGVIMMALLFGGIAGGGLFTSAAVGEIGQEMRDRAERDRTDRWYREGGGGKVPYYGDREYKANNQQMGDPTLDLNDNRSDYYSNY